jgi:hypothetical protein
MRACTKDDRKLFLDIFIPEWWEPNMIDAIMALTVRMDYMVNYFDNDSDYMDYILDKTKIINMQEQLEKERKLIEEYDD